MEPQSAGDNGRDLQAELAEAQAQLRGMERIFQAVFGGPR